MADELPPGWSLQPDKWPYWLPGALWGLFPNSAMLTPSLPTVPPNPNVRSWVASALPFLQTGNASTQPGNLPPAWSPQTHNEATRTTMADLAEPASEPWISGARYAQSTPRRGPRGPGGRELSPPEEIRSFLHNNAHQTLRGLDPRNPQLQSLSSPSWVPTNADINQLNREIARIKRERGWPIRNTAAIEMP
jgi:hypothetical protein